MIDNFCLQAVLKKGQDPAADAKEKALMKVATRGVVRLFNAVSKAQKQQKDALTGGKRTSVSSCNGCCGTGA